MKVDLNQEVDLTKVARGIFVVSFAAFIFTSMLAVSVSNASIISSDNAASVASSKIAIVSSLQDEGRGGATGGSVGLPINPETGVVPNTAPPTVAPTVMPTDIPSTPTQKPIIKPPVITAKVDIVASPMKVSAKGVSKISWKSEDVKSCEVKKDGEHFSYITATNASGKSSGQLIKDTKFTIECVSEAGLVSDSVTVLADIVPLVTVVAEAKQTEVDYGESTVISWKAENAKFCSVKKDATRLPSKLLSGSVNSGSLTKNARFTVECNGIGESNVATSFVDISVKPLSMPTSKIDVDKTSVLAGEAVSVSWSSTGANKCSVMSGTRNIGNSTTGANVSVTMKESSVLWILCSNSMGTTASAVSVQVAPIKQIARPIVEENIPAASPSKGGKTVPVI